MAKLFRVVFRALLLLVIAAIVWVVQISKTMDIDLRSLNRKCEPFVAGFGGDTVRFPVLVSDTKLEFKGMDVEKYHPACLYRVSGDTTVEAYFQTAYDREEFKPRVRKGNLTERDQRISTIPRDFDDRGIYAYGFYLPESSFYDTFERLKGKYGSAFETKRSLNDGVEYQVWDIDGCTRVLLFKYENWENRERLNEKWKTGVFFTYRLTEREIIDIVELGGGLRAAFD